MRLIGAAVVALVVGSLAGSGWFVLTRQSDTRPISAPTLPDTRSSESSANSQPPSTTKLQPQSNPEPRPTFEFQVSPISKKMAAFMTGKSWKPGCPVPIEDLRSVEMSFWNWQGEVVTGTVIVHRDAVDATVLAFRRLFDIEFPIRQMEPIDKYRSATGEWADDSASIDADNTSAFNCRAVTGGTGWSEHAYGRAIDINPVENPYVLDGRVARSSSEPYIDRKLGKGVLLTGDRAVRAFTENGWKWGGEWSNPIDYQHFSTTGR